jgi:Tol biopolymer transport system component
MKRAALVILVVMVAATVSAAQDLERLFKAAVNTETVDRNCKAAIEQYKRVAAGSNRALAAQALLRMAGCYQQLGDGEAQRIYQRLVRDFADQKEAAAQAQARLIRSESQRPLGDRIVQAQAGTSGEGRISPDGRFMSYVSWGGPKGLNLMLRDVIANTDRALTDVDWNGGAAGESAFSPDGKQLAYGWMTYGTPPVHEVRVVTLDSTGIPRPRTVYSNADVEAFSPTDWSPDGRSLAVVVRRKDGTNQVALIGLDGSFRALRTIEGWRAIGKVFFSPDGKHLAYNTPISDTDPRRDLFVITTDASAETPIQDPADDVVMGWSPDGHYLLFASDRNTSVGLWAAPIVNGKQSTASILVRPDIGTVLSQGLTKSGALFIVKDASTVNLQVAPVDLESGKFTGPSVMQIYRPQTPQSPAWSPDGKRLAYIARSASGRVHLAIRDVASGRTRELYPPLVYIPQLQWFADGRSLLVHGRDIKWRFMTFRIDVESGQESLIVRDVMERVQLSPDGKKAYYTIGDGGASRAGTVFEHDLSTGTRRQIFRKPDVTGTSVLSPDGRWFVFIRTPALDLANPGSTKSTVFLHPVDSGTPREIEIPAVLEAFFGFDWAPDGKAVLIPGRSPEAALWHVPVGGGMPRKLDIDINPWLTGYGIRVAPNGKQIAFFSGQARNEVWALENVIPAATK